MTPSQVPMLGIFAAAMAAMMAVGGGALHPLQRIHPFLGIATPHLGKRRHASHTKKGPGRRHLQGDGSKAAKRAMVGPFGSVA
jgi:hypothetical protein